MTAKGCAKDECEKEGCGLWLPESDECSIPYGARALHDVAAALDLLEQTLERTVKILEVVVARTEGEGEHA